MKKAIRRLTTGQVLIVIFLLALCFVVLFPFFWAFISSFKLERDIIRFPPSVFAKEYTLDQYRYVLAAIPIVRQIGNTVIFAGSVAVISVIIDSMAAYAFARMPFRGRTPLFSLVLITMMIPFQILMIPLYLLVYSMGLLDTYAGLIIPRMASAFGIFMMRSFFVALPKDLEDAARIDGLSEFGIFFRVILPLCKAALATLFIFTLMGNWNDLLYPLMITSKSEMRTISAGLAMFSGEMIVKNGPTLAATMISITPLLLLYFFAQKYFVQGIAMSGIKD